MNNNRRKFLKNASGLAASMLLPMHLFPAASYAATSGKKLVVLTLMGGNDGLNLAIPTDSAQYALYESYRPNIKIPMANILPFGMDASGMAFGLHPSMASLMPLMDKLALFPATHNGHANRSHFFQHDLYDAGLYDTDPSTGDGKGWLGRYFDNKYTITPSGVVAQDFTGGHLALLKGDTFVLDLVDPSNVDLGAGSAAKSTAIWNDIKGLNVAPETSYAGKYAAKQSILFDDMLGDLTSNVNFGRMANSTYPSVAIGSQFKKAADMIIGLPNLEVIHIMQGGYDTHNNQGSVAADNRTQSKLFLEMADTLAAFYNDLGMHDPAVRQEVVVVLQTEFGRTVKDNGSGTDHGHASCWVAFGDAVQGGVYGSYPGLEPENLNGPGSDLARRNWLRPTIDYRDIFSELIGPKFLGASDPNGAFLGYSGPATPLNFII